tara:strand:+ start:206 stop:490 length:285 start_codon:yes stop_codon:yes gene_type:complete
MFDCRICGETQLYNYYCEDCSITRRICLTYGKKEVRDILEKVCLRNKKQMNNKINIIKDKLDKEERKEKKELGDETYINPNESMLEELKKKLKK